jgi:hypothetical protein
MALRNAFEDLAVSSKQAALLTDTPSQNVSAPPVRPVGQTIHSAGFASVGASVLDTFFATPFTRNGVTYSQGTGALSIVAGTTANGEFLARSVDTFFGSMRMKFSIISSQRIANNNLAVLLADLIGEALSYNIINATTVDVTVTAHGFTAQNVGQFVMMGAISGAAGIPGRYAIASIPDANTIRFTVAGFPASGTGTCTLFGRNYIRNLFTGTTATNLAFDAQRNGWATGDTTATINTTASPGTVVINEFTGREVFLMDKLRITSTTPTVTARASRDENIPDSTTTLYVFLWNYNGTSNPASSTTWTLAHLSVEDFVNFPVYIQGARPNGAINPIPVTFPAAQSVTFPSAQAVSGTVTANIGTGALSAGTNAIGDVGVQYRANNTGAASIASVISLATTATTSVKATAGRLIGFDLVNTSAALRSVKIFNVASPTMGTTAAVFEIDIPAGQRVTVQYPGGLGFGTAIVYAVTSAKGLTDNTNTGLAAGDVSGHIAFA